MIGLSVTTSLVRRKFVQVQMAYESVTENQARRGGSRFWVDGTVYLELRGLHMVINRVSSGGLYSGHTSISGGAVSSPVIGSSVTVERHRTRRSLLDVGNMRADCLGSAHKPLRLVLLAMVVCGSSAERTDWK